MGKNLSAGSAQDRQEERQWAPKIDSEDIAEDWTRGDTEAASVLRCKTRPSPAKSQWIRTDLFFKSSRDNDVVLPEFEGTFFHFGRGADQECVIYTRICLPNDATKDLVSWLDPESNTEIEVGLKYHEKEFIRRRMPFRRGHFFNFTLDVKFGVRCNQKEFPVLITHLSCTISVLLGPIGFAADVKVFESDEIFYGPLAHTMACLSVCQFTHAQSDPPLLTTHANCYIFLDRVSSETEVCSDCSTGSHLMTIFKGIKNSPGTVDLARL